MTMKTNTTNGSLMPSMPEIRTSKPFDREIARTRAAAASQLTEYSGRIRE
jgi:hypothetical protein